MGIMLWLKKLHIETLLHLIIFIVVSICPEFAEMFSCHFIKQLLDVWPGDAFKNRICETLTRCISIIV